VRRAKRTIGRSLFSRCQTATQTLSPHGEERRRRVSNHEGTQVDPGPPMLREGPSGLLGMRRCCPSRDVTQRSLIRSQAYVSSFPRRVCASGFVSFLRIHPRTRGWRSADRRTLLCYVARARRDDRVSETRAVPLQPGRPLGAPSWRFSAGDPCCRLRQWHRSRPATCPRQPLRPDGRGPGPPALRFAPQSRDATPRSIVRIVSGGRPLRARIRSCTINPLRSQELSSFCSRKLRDLGRTFARARAADAERTEG
jgi:hypothetical protein